MLFSVPPKVFECFVHIPNSKEKLDAKAAECIFKLLSAYLWVILVFNRGISYLPGKNGRVCYHGHDIF